MNLHYGDCSCNGRGEEENLTQRRRGRRDFTEIEIQEHSQEWLCHRGAGVSLAFFIWMGWDKMAGEDSRDECFDTGGE